MHSRMLCRDDRVRVHLNATTLKNIAMQYSMDVMRYGYL